MYKFIKSKCQNFCTDTAVKIFVGDKILLSDGRAYSEYSPTYQETKEAQKLLDMLAAREPAHWDTHTSINY